MRCVSFCGNLFLFKKFRRGVYLSADNDALSSFIATTYLMLQHSKTQLHIFRESFVGFERDSI